MANATITTSSGTAGNLDGLANLWLTAMQNCGWSLEETVSSTGGFREHNVSKSFAVTGATYEAAHVSLRVDNGGTASQTLIWETGSSFNTGSNVMENAGVNNSSASFNVSEYSSNFTFYEIDHPEVSGVIILKDGIFFAKTLCFRPATLPGTIDENNYPFYFVNNDVDSDGHAYATISSLRAGGTSANMLLNSGNSTGTGGNPSDLDARLVGAKSVISNNDGVGNTNAVAQFTDIAAIASDGMEMLGIVGLAGAEYSLIEPPSATELRLAVRTA